MHSMLKSANRSASRRATSRHIARCALRLADERGLDGFTMDELADEASVSRRTLFNYFPGKVDAVLGPIPEPPAEALEVFGAGGPHGDLVQDLGELVTAMLAEEELDREDVTRHRRLLLAEPKLMAATHDRMVRLSEQIVEATVAREGPTFRRRRARVAVAVLAALFDASLEDFLTDPRKRGLPHHFQDSLRTARELLG
jgi:AcrR family transcriptional regulator